MKKYITMTTTKVITKYSIITCNSWRVIARDFSSWTDAFNWASNNDNGQYEEEGGWYIVMYTK